MSSAHDTIRFVLDGSVVEVDDVPATTTVLEYLRGPLGRTGTKEGCAEGDCGACTVVIGELSGEAIRYRAINSCIRYLGTIDGMELVTSESLASAQTLHPVQQAMVDQHASQCGFCTPGFVMSLFALYQRSASADREDVVTALAGNLCRCTGYRPIVAAGEAMHGYAQPDQWSRADAQSTERRHRLIQLKRKNALQFEGFKAPRSSDELAEMFAAHPDSLLLAGGTDIGLWTTKQLREVPPLIYVGEVEDLKHIEDRGDDGLLIGAAVSLTDAWRAIVNQYPGLADLARRFASPPVCNSGTLCGNVANGSPIGDSMPALIALGAHVELRLGAERRRLPLEAFYLGYQRKDLRPGEFVSGIAIPPPRDDVRVASYKVSKRFDQDIASVCVGMALQLTADRVTDIRIAYGGMAAIPSRALQTERALRGGPWTLASIEAAIDTLAADFQPMTDMRGSAGYRTRIAGNLLRRFFNETETTVPSLRAAHG